MTGLFPEAPIAAASPKGLGRAMAGGATVERQGNDYYPTPPAATRAFLAAERLHLLDAVDLDHAVWEPCGRGGAISTQLEKAGFTTIATDLVPDPVHRVTGQNLLTCRRAYSPVVVTNRPFTLAADMIRHLLGDLECTYVALLLKATYWHAEKRTGLWRWRTPVRIYALNWRLDCLGLGNPTMEFIWVVWDARRDGPCIYDVLTRFCAPDLLGEG